MFATTLKQNLRAALANEKAGEDLANLANGLDYEVTFTVGAEAANVINVAGQVKDAAGDNVSGVRTLLLGLFTTAAGVAFNATNYTTIAIGTNGAALEIVADKLLIVRTNSSGAFDLNITLSSGGATSYLAQLKADGSIVASGAITHAA